MYHALKSAVGAMPLSLTQVEHGSTLHSALELFPALRKDPWFDAASIVWRMRRLADNEPRAAPKCIDLVKIRVDVYLSLIDDVRNNSFGDLQSVYGATKRALHLAKKARADAARAGRVDAELDAALHDVNTKLSAIVERSRGLRF